ncbi:hypothetical protein [Sphingopyxis lindanitolerans]|nr:hypothetical protein [Sphingopyxis lindanitolerans]
MRIDRKQAAYAVAAAMALVMAGCTAVPTPQTPPPAPAPRPAPTPAPLPTASQSWEDRALNPGAWRYDADSRSATFVQAGSPSPLLTLRCAGGALHLTAPLDGPVALRTSAGTDQIRFDGGAATVPSRDLRLDRIAFSRGRFALESGSGALTLPVQSEIGRVIEDCRG